MSIPLYPYQVDTLDLLTTRHPILDYIPRGRIPKIDREAAISSPFLARNKFVSEAMAAHLRQAVPGVNYDLTSSTRRTADAYVITYTWTMRRDPAYFLAMASLEHIRHQIGSMTEDELLAAAEADPLAYARGLEATADQMEADAAQHVLPPPGVAESVKVLRDRALEIRARAGL